MKIIYRMLQSIVSIILITWLCLSVLVYFMQPMMVYFPEQSVLMTPADIGLEYEDITITTEDNVSLHGWFIPHKQAVATMLFLHGNAGNISHRLESLLLFHQLGLAVFIIDYRGYGQSTGTPTEDGSYIDAQTAWYYLTREKQIAADDIVIFGRSLGGAVAVWLAAREPAGALILESTFTSLIDMGKHYYPYLPIKWLARISYPSIERISLITCPVLIIHSPEDELIPYEFSEQLYQSAGQPKSFLAISGGHNDGFLNSGALYINGLQQFLQQYVYP